MVKNRQKNNNLAFERVSTSPNSWMAIVSVVSALVFFILLVVIALALPNPTPFQLYIFRVILALAAASFGATIPGFIRIDVPLWGKGLIRAGGALALFVLIYMVNPPEIIKEGQGGQINSAIYIPAPAISKKENQILCGTVWSKKGEDSEPLEGVEVSIPEFNISKTSDKYGRFCFEVYAENEANVRLIAKKNNYKLCTHDATLGNITLDISMEAVHVKKS